MLEGGCVWRCGLVRIGVIIGTWGRRDVVSR